MIAETFTYKMIKRVEAKIAIAELLQKHSDPYAIERYLS